MVTLSTFPNVCQNDHFRFFFFQSITVSVIYVVNYTLFGL